jgi:hypothetical protein
VRQGATPSPTLRPTRPEGLSVTPLSATLMDLLASVANKGLTAKLSPLDATLTRNEGEGHYSWLPTLYFRPRLDLPTMPGQRAKTEVVRPPRGVNSPRTTHHSGRTAATMSRRILLTAFS